MRPGALPLITSLLEIYTDHFEQLIVDIASARTGASAPSMRKERVRPIKAPAAIARVLGAASGPGLRSMQIIEGVQELVPEAEADSIRAAINRMHAQRKLARTRDSEGRFVYRLH